MWSCLLCLIIVLLGARIPVETVMTIVTVNIFYHFLGTDMHKKSHIPDHSGSSVLAPVV